MPLYCEVARQTAFIGCYFRGRWFSEISIDMLTGPCLSLILLYHRVKSGYPVREKNCVADGLGCPGFLPAAGHHPQQRVEVNARIDCTFRTAKGVFPWHGEPHQPRQMCGVVSNGLMLQPPRAGREDEDPPSRNNINVPHTLN